jgi:hypothetical protein
MDGLIKNHYIKQRTTKDFAMSFKVNDLAKQQLPSFLTSQNSMKSSYMDTQEPTDRRSINSPEKPESVIS